MAWTHSVEVIASLIVLVFTCYRTITPIDKIMLHILLSWSVITITTYLRRKLRELVKRYAPAKVCQEPEEEHKIVKESSMPR